MSPPGIFELPAVDKGLLDASELADHLDCPPPPPPSATTDGHSNSANGAAHLANSVNGASDHSSEDARTRQHSHSSATLPTAFETIEVDQEQDESDALSHAHPEGNGNGNGSGNGHAQGNAASGAGARSDSTSHPATADSGTSSVKGRRSSSTSHSAVVAVNGKADTTMSGAGAARHRRSSSLASASGFPTANGNGARKARTESMASTATNASSLREQILEGLIGSPDWIVPGDEEEDQAWKYKKRVPTMVLYDEQGLRLYDRITEEAPEYYPFQAELNLFKNHGSEIALAMGFPSPKDHHHHHHQQQQQQQQQHPNDGTSINVAARDTATSEKWGDAQVGKWNQGVNGEEGVVNGHGPLVDEKARQTTGARPLQNGRHLDSQTSAGAAKDWDVVELGAGSLRKTSHFLNALARTVEPNEQSPPIRYHALDLSHPELVRTLHQLDQANADAFRGKIAVGGLWGDYDRGIDYIQHGGLEQLKGLVSGTAHETEHEHEPEPLVTLQSPILAANKSITSNASTGSISPSRSGSLPPLLRRMSNSSFSSFRLDATDSVEEDLDHLPQLIKGIRHATKHLDPTKWKEPSFKSQVLELLQTLKIRRWSSSSLQPSNVHIVKISGACTNAVFFCSYNPDTAKPTQPIVSPLLTPSLPGVASLPADRVPPTLLLRIYGPSSGTLIERNEELRTLHTLSDRYGLGPRLEGTFENGRIEQFFDSRALKVPEIKDPDMSRCIAARMRELHSVDLKALGYDREKEDELYVWKCLRDWLPHAKKVAKELEQIPEWSEWSATMGLDRLEAELTAYKKWVEDQKDIKPSRVFAHNDTQNGNILLLDRRLPPNEPEHHKLIVIDFEYAAPNPRGYDIANHFHEWQGNYNHPTLSYSLRHHDPYPTRDQRDNFYRGYLAVHMDSRDGKERIFDPRKIKAEQLNILEKEVRVWSPAVSAFWALWGVVQAREQIEGIVSGTPDANPEFDYLLYALGRLEMFREEAARVGALPKPQGASAADGSGAAFAHPTEALAAHHAEEHPRHILFLGSSLGNFDRKSAAPFLAGLPLRAGSSDSLLLGLDGRPAAVDMDGVDGKTKVEVAYNDPKGRTRDFIMHGLDVMKTELLSVDTGKVVLSPEDFKYKSRYNVKLGRHEAYYESLRDQILPADEDHPEIHVSKGETLNIEWSYKYSMLESLELFERSNLRVVDYWQDPKSEYRLWLLQRPPLRFTVFPIDSETGQCGGPHNPDLRIKWPSVPERDEWKALWRFWDTITLGMISDKLLHEKPIDLRHKCLFYLGHIPAFLDIHLTRLTNGKHTEPEHYKDIFERGIDPNVDDPSQIHAHSAVPERDEDWPSLDEILDFRNRVRTRLFSIMEDLETGKLPFTRRAARTLWMTFEHEAFHAETLLYMLIQSRATLPAPGFAKPKWAHLAARWDSEYEPSRILDVPACEVVLGHNDAESKDGDFAEPSKWNGHEFGWDNENPAAKVAVSPFRAESLPVTNGEYLDYMRQQNLNSAPASWVQESGEWKVRTLYGPVDFSVARLWPLKASYNELAAFASWKGGRLPSEAELYALWNTQHGPRPATLNGNVALRNWHPIPPTNTKLDTCGRLLYGHNGGVWEWTSTLFEGLPGFEAGELYPLYSTDFFDGVHGVVLGGSYASHSRLATRRSLRNFYQRNYPYAWIGGRVVYDV